METAAINERVGRIIAARSAVAPTRSAIEAAFAASAELKSWLAASDAALARALDGLASFPEQAIADCTRSTLNEGVKAKERSGTLASVPNIAEALDAAATTTAHVDAITKAVRSLDDDAQRDELLGRIDGLADVAAEASVEDFRRRLRLEVKALQHDDGLAGLDRQRRNTRVRTWTDNDGMWRISGQFDPVTGVKLSARLDAAVQALFAEAEPTTCPADPIEKQHHLRGLALARLLSGDVASVGRAGRPEFVVVVDACQPDGAGGPSVDWGIPVEVPGSVLADMAGEGDVELVVVRNGVVLHASGQLDLGRTTRLANRAQRRALRGLYRTCAIPGCAVPYHRTKLHHVEYWRNGGRTDLCNLLPLCAHHHAKVHRDNWQLELDANRGLTIRFPDGTVRNTGPPNRNAA